MAPKQANNSSSTFYVYWALYNRLQLPEQELRFSFSDAKHSWHQHLPVCSNEQCSYTSLKNSKKNFDRSCSITSGYSDQHNLVYLLAKLRSFEQGKGRNVVNCNVTRLRNCRGFTNSYTKPACLRSRASL